MARRLIVTLPPAKRVDAALAFARRAKSLGADVLEIRSDLHSENSIDPSQLAGIIALLVARRRTPLAESWKRAATEIDYALEDKLPLDGATVVAFHSSEPLSTAAALQQWEQATLPARALIKHVEPLGALKDTVRLFTTQRALADRFGHDRVTVLATGPYALPFRCVLAENNALDYCALDANFASAPGQRLLADAVRCRVAERTGRLAIVGTQISGSRSPRIHPQPFDRVDLPEDAPVGELIEAIRRFYVGFAVTSPFKKILASHFRAREEAINTLARTSTGWRTANTDVAGARAVLEKLAGETVTVLGDGGVTAALNDVARAMNRKLVIRRRADISVAAPLSGPCVWTWPERIAPPEGLRFQSATVAIVAYGQSAKAIAKEVEARGGKPLRLGARWFIAQAREQRAIWEDAE